MLNPPALNEKKQNMKNVIVFLICISVCQKAERSIYRHEDLFTPFHISKIEEKPKKIVTKRKNVKKKKKE